MQHTDESANALGTHCNLPCGMFKSFPMSGSMTPHPETATICRGSSLLNATQDKPSSTPTRSRLARNAARIIPIVPRRLRRGYTATSRCSRLIRLMKRTGLPWLSPRRRSTQLESAFRTCRWFDRKGVNRQPFMMRRLGASQLLMSFVTSIVIVKFT